jgi:guanine deaminase
MHIGIGAQAVRSAVQVWRRKNEAPSMPTQNHSDRHFLSRAVALSRVHMVVGDGGPFGAVIVKDGQVISEGWNQVTSTNDPTAHAEMVAIRRAAAAVSSFSLAGATIYSSCEPCPMCLAAIYWARLDRVVYALTAADAAAIGFDDQWIYDEIAKSTGQRNLPSTHLPMPEAQSVFEDWRTKADVIRY